MEKAISSDLIRGHIDTIILYSLLDGDKYAQQISDAIEKKSEKQYEINQATLYSALKRLENLKQVEAYWYDADNGRRRYFKLTEIGKQTVESNLSNWAYSRSIIDKLMDTAPEPVVKTEYVEKIVTVPVVTEKIIEKQPEVIVEAEKTNTVASIPAVSNIKKEDKSEVVYNNLSESDRANIRSILFDNKEKDSPFAPLFANKTTKNNEESAINEEIKEEKSPEISVEIKENQQKVEEVNKTEEKDEKEINFRNILNGLIITTTVKKKVQNEQIEPELANETISEEDLGVKSFNETLAETEYNAQKPNNHGKIDFGDLAIEAAKEGYKLRISSKEPKISQGALYGNKLNVCSALIVFLLVMLELLYFTVRYKDVLNFSAALIIGLIIAFIVFPIILAVIFYKNPNKTTKSIKPDLLLTVAIIIFNLLLITFAGNLLFGIDFSDKKSYLLGIAIPLALYLDVFTYYLLKFFLAKHKFFIVNKKNKK